MITSPVKMKKKNDYKKENDHGRDVDNVGNEWRSKWRLCGGSQNSNKKSEKINVVVRNKKRVGVLSYSWSALRRNIQRVGSRTTLQNIIVSVLLINDCLILFEFFFKLNSCFDFYISVVTWLEQVTTVHICIKRARTVGINWSYSLLVTSLISCSYPTRIFIIVPNGIKLFYIL